MKIYLVRHGETEHNSQGYYSNKDESLNEKGVEQANELKIKVSNIDYDVCYCSPLIRARQTAEIINHDNRIIVTINALRERNPGNKLNGVPLEDTDREEYWKYDSKIDYGAEPMKDLFDRVFKFLDELKLGSHKCVLIVAHSGVSKAFNAYFNGMPEDKKFLHLGLKNCEVKEYEL